MKKIITLLGSTGSIGTQTLDVVRMHGLEVYALAAYHNVSLLEQQVREFHPKKVCIFDESCYQHCKMHCQIYPWKFSPEWMACVNWHRIRTQI